jgi:hypothetical protein
MNLGAALESHLAAPPLSGMTRLFIINQTAENNVQVVLERVDQEKAGRQTYAMQLQNIRNRKTRV